MKKIALTLAVIAVLCGKVSSQKYYKLSNTLVDNSLFNDAVTMSDGSFLLVMNHTKQDTSTTELLKVNALGDTLKHRFFTLNTSLSAAAAVTIHNTVVLSIATGHGCRFSTTDHGFTFIKLDNDLTEIGRKSYSNSSISEIPAGPVKFSGNKFYCFDPNGVYVFDKDFNFTESYSGFRHSRCNDFDVINNKIVCTEYDSTGIELKALNGTRLNFINRVAANDVKVYQGNIYVAAELSILKLDDNLTVLDSTIAYGRHGSVGFPDNLAIYNNELIVFQHRETFCRYSLPDLKLIPNTYGEFRYEGSFNHAVDWYGRALLANDAYAAKFGIEWKHSCIIGDPYAYYLAHFETSQQGVTFDYSYYLENVTVDTVWVEELSRYPDYEPYEFNLDVAVKLTNDSGEKLKEFEIGLNHNLDTACLSPNMFIKNIERANILSGGTDTVFFRNLKINPGKDFDSLFLNLASMVLTQNREIPSVWDYCGWTWRFIHKNQIVKKERPTPVKTPRYKVFPNPVLEKLTFDGILPQGAQVRVYNLSGKLIYDKHFDTEETEWELDVSMLPDAMYLLEISNSNFNELSKFVKQ